MVEIVSAIGPAAKPGQYGAPDPQVRLAELRFGSLVQLTAFPGKGAAVRSAIRKCTGSTLRTLPGSGAVGKGKRIFGIAPDTWLVITAADATAQALLSVLDRSSGTVTDLTHGRTVIIIDGPKAEWVLAKLFAIDFSVTAFPVGSGLSTSHHEIFVNIQRTETKRFEICVFRSFARSFWKALCHAAEETGYEVGETETL